MSGRLYLLAMIVGCASAPLHKDEVLEVPLTSATYVSNAHAIRLLTSARCRHEAECGNRTTGCFDAANLDERSAVGLDACPFGVARDRLDRCISAVNLRRCASRMTSLSNIPVCLHAELCR